MVEEGLLAQSAAELIDFFTISIRDKRPFIRLKWAQSLDGRIACRGGASRWVTNQAARDAAHDLRACHDAILIGANTLRVDDPQLTPRSAGNAAHGPAATDRPAPRAGSRRVVLAGLRPLNMAARLFSPTLRKGTTVLAATASPALGQCRDAEIRVIEIRCDEGGLPDLEESFHALYADGVGSVMVEGGAALHTSLLKRGLWDALTVFVAPLILGEGVAAVDDLGILSPNQGIAFEEFRVEAGASFARIDARRGETSKGRQQCLRD
jgi:diaminohydroxyphosphoribosylaminopyrimidine deaminase/5-amino-6-(5-phosphoribosylamino)uracil reductase